MVRSFVGDAGGCTKLGVWERSALGASSGSSLGSCRGSNIVDTIGGKTACVEKILARQRRASSYLTGGGGTGPYGTGWRRASVRDLAELVARFKEDGDSMVTWVRNHARVSEASLLHLLETHTW